MFDQLLQIFVLQLTEAFHVGKIHRIVALAVRADVFINEFSFALQNANAPAMEPILALVTANVELRFIVRLSTQAVQFLGVSSVLTFAAYELGMILRVSLRDADTLSMEPVVAQIAANVESVD